VVGYGGALLDLTPARRGSGDVEKRTDQLRLPCVAVSNDRKVANGFGGVDFHKSERVLSEIRFWRQTSSDFICNEKTGCDCGLSDNLAEREAERQVSQESPPEPDKEHQQAYKTHYCVHGRKLPMS
jgi:hypothetical protein